MHNVAEIALFTTASRLIRRAAFCGMGVDQFLASKIYMAGFKQTDWRHSSSPILPFRPVGRHLSPNQGLARGQIAPQRRLVGHVTMSIHQRYPLGWLRALGSWPRAAGRRAAALC